MDNTKTDALMRAHDHLRWLNHFLTEAGANNRQNVDHIKSLDRSITSRLVCSRPKQPATS